MTYEERLKLTENRLTDKHTGFGYWVIHADVRECVAMQAEAIREVLKVSSRWTATEVNHYLKQTGYIPEKEEE